MMQITSIIQLIALEKIAECEERPNIHQLSEMTGTAYNNLTKHMKTLEMIGLITTERQGAQMLLRITNTGRLIVRHLK